jgi:hypothetical protein
MVFPPAARAAGFRARAGFGALFFTRLLFRTAINPPDVLGVFQRFSLSSFPKPRRLLKRTKNARRKSSSRPSCSSWLREERSWTKDFIAPVRHSLHAASHVG